MSHANAPAVPAALADVALIDGPTAAAAAAMSISQFKALVIEGRAPMPFVQERRFTRWRVADVRRWLESGLKMPASGSPA